MTDLDKATDDELVKELTRRGSMPRCKCGRWQTYLGLDAAEPCQAPDGPCTCGEGAYDADGYTLRCHGCLRAIARCTCG